MPQVVPVTSRCADDISKWKRDPVRNGRDFGVREDQGWEAEQPANVNHKGATNVQHDIGPECARNRQQPRFVLKHLQCQPENAFACSAQAGVAKTVSIQ